jgi:methylenetetrahydrofolate reductase (NADPH)
MRVTEIIQKNQKPFASFELVPPLKGSDISKLYSSIEPLMEFCPPYINITTHRDEIEYRQMQDGNFRQITITKRPGTVAIAAAIMKKFNIEVVPHVICGGSSKSKIENVLVDLNFLGIENVMALRGDAVPGEKFFTPDLMGYRHSKELVAQIGKMNNGFYLDDTLKDAVHSNFCIGVAGYPEKHCEAPNIDEDIWNLRRKVDAGADYIVTQMFFNNSAFFEFEKRCRMAGITVPIIPGIKPISSLRHIKLLPKTFSIDIPQDFTDEIYRCKDDSQIYEAGIEWSIAQCRELLSHGCKAIHFYTMGKAGNIREIVKKLF